MTDQWFRAVREGDLATVRALAEQGFDVNTRNEDDDDAYDLASRPLNMDMCVLLNELGAEGCPWNRPPYPLIGALESGDKEGVATLLEQGADPNFTGRGTRKGAEPPLTVAMKCRFDDAIQLLVDYGADPNYTHDDGFSAVTYAIAWSRRWRHVFADFEPNPRPLELLLAAGARFGLMDAVLLNDVELARAPLDEGADPNLGRWGYCGPVLSVAAMLGHKEIVELLLDRGAELDLVDDRCTTPLMDAAAEGQLEIVRLLLDRGADIDFVGFHTALERAAFYDRQDVVDHLLARGAKRGILDAIALDEVSLLEGLLHQCVDIDKMMHGGCRMITFAVRRGSAPIVRLLLNRGAAHSASFEHHPLLTEAAIHGHAHIAKLLIDRGANLHATGKDGRTALSWAIEKGHQTVVECLRHAGTSR